MQTDLDNPTNSHSRYMAWEDIGRASEAWKVASGAPGSPYDEFRAKYLPLPEWFVQGLAPLSAEYLAQQDRLWMEMVGSADDYNPISDEITDDRYVDAVKSPGLYSAPADSAGDHLIALGHIVKYSGVNRGDRVLEYGAGFGQIALTFARMGCEVHTVDIDETFCRGVAAQAEHFSVDLTPHRNEFGHSPGGQFNLIIFYEAFHHARNFASLIPAIRDMLVPGGRLLMAAEPIRPASDPNWSDGTCPFPWGIRLEAEVAAIVRFRRWYELGFQQEFLVDLFAQHGFSHVFRPGVLTSYADMHEFQKL